MIKVFVTDVSALTPEAAERLYASLPRWRQDKLWHIHITKQKILSAGAGFLLAPAFDSFGLDAHTARVSVNEHGKPYLPDAPGVHFSLSHSGSMAMCAVADSPVGCDIQELSSARRGERVARRFFTPAEYARITAAAGPEREFARLWTLKESYVKYLGTGIDGCPLDSFELVGEPPTLARAGNASIPLFCEYAFDGQPARQPTGQPTSHPTEHPACHLAAVCCAQTPGEASYVSIEV